MEHTNIYQTARTLGYTGKPTWDDLYTGVRDPSGVALGDAVLDLMGRISVLSTLVVLFFGFGAKHGNGVIGFPVRTHSEMKCPTIRVLYQVEPPQ